MSDNNKQEGDETTSGPALLSTYDGFSVGDCVWASRRNDWFFVAIDSIRLPVINKPRFGVTDLTNGDQFICDSVMTDKQFAEKNPMVNTLAW